MCRFTWFFTPTLYGLLQRLFREERARVTGVVGVTEVISVMRSGLGLAGWPVGLFGWARVGLDRGM